MRAVAWTQPQSIALLFAVAFCLQYLWHHLAKSLMIMIADVKIPPDLMLKIGTLALFSANISCCTTSECTHATMEHWERPRETSCCINDVTKRWRLLYWFVWKKFQGTLSITMPQWAEPRRQYGSHRVCVCPSVCPSVFSCCFYATAEK